MRRSWLRSTGVAFALALVLLLATRQLGCNNYAKHTAYREQVSAFLSGRLALDTSPRALAHDLAWTPTGVQQVWGLGVPLWQTPFELAARSVSLGPFPDRIALLFWIGLALLVLIRAFRSDDEPWWIGGGAVLIAGLLPAFVTMLRGSVGVYEEAAAYAYTAAVMLLGGLTAFAKRPTHNRYLLLLLAAGVTGFIRPTVWFYGLATAILATAIYVRHYHRRVLPIVALGIAVFVAGGAMLYALNDTRFGKGSEFGHRLNIEALPGNVYATRFSYPFERVGLADASVELAGALFGQPERASDSTFYGQDLHVGQSATPRWREYYFTTFSWPYLALILAGLVLGVLAWRRGKTERWLAAWAVIGGLPLAAFYLRSPSVSSRYMLDLAPAIVAFLIISWSAFARWMVVRGRGRFAPLALAALWILAVVTGQKRGNAARTLEDRDEAARGRYELRVPSMQPADLPAAYVLGSPDLERWLDADGKPPELYINGTGWHRPDGHVAPTATFYMTDPSFVELDVEPATAQVQVAIGLHHLPLVSTEPIEQGARMRFALPDGVALRGLQVAFVAFGPDTGLGRKETDVILRRIGWR